MDLVKRIFYIFFIPSLIITIFFFKSQASAKNIFGFYYGNFYSEDWNNYENLVIDLNKFPLNSHSRISRSSARLITYLSIGETVSLIKGDKLGPGGYASWYLDRDKDNFPDRNKSWGSYYVNAGNKAWQEYILNKIIPRLPDDLIGGIFLDTVDVIDIYPETVDGMIFLINKIKKNNPNLYIVQNRGFSIITKTIESIDALLFEDFSTYYNFKKREYYKWKDNDLEYINQIGYKLNILRRYYPIGIWTLDYSREDNMDMQKYIKKRALQFDFIPSVTNIQITRLDFMDPFPLPNQFMKMDKSLSITGFKMERQDKKIRYVVNRGIYNNIYKGHYQIYINTRKPTDRYYSPVKGFTANYMVEDGKLYKYNGRGNKWSWSFSKNVFNSIVKNTIVTEFELSYIGIKKNTFVGAMWVSLDDKWRIIERKIYFG